MSTLDALPVGSILAYAVDVLDPTHTFLWQFCQGQHVSKKDYPELFEMIGDSNGPSIQTDEFRLPDLQGYFLRGVDETGKIDKDRFSASGANPQLFPGSVQSSATAKPATKLEVTIPHLPLEKIGAIDPKKQSNNSNPPTTTDSDAKATDMVNFNQDSTTLTLKLKSALESVPVNIYMQYIIKVSPTPVIPIGSIIPYGGKNKEAPDLGLWALCEGNWIETASMRHLNLYTVINDRYGRRRNASRFNLPDLRGRFIRGVDNNTDINVRRDKNDRVPPPGLAKVSANVNVAGSTQAFATGRPDDTPNPLTVTLLNYPIASSESSQDAAGSSCLQNENKAAKQSWEGGDFETRPVNVNVQYFISLAEKYFDSDIMPVGSIIAIPGQGVPNDKYWKRCDGTSFLKTALHQLSAACGTIWGSADGKSFNLPDLRGQFLRGTDTSDKGLDPDRSKRGSKKGGSVQGTGSSQGYGTHIDLLSLSIDISIPDSQLKVKTTRQDLDLTAYNQDSVICEVGGGDTETRPANVAVHFYIKCATVSGI